MVELVALILTNLKSGKFPLRISCECARSTGVICLHGLFKGKGLPEPEFTNKRYPQNQQTVSRFFMQQDTNIQIDIGLAVRQKMSEQGTTIAWLARQIDYDRSNLGKQLQNEHNLS